jgi:hypothetical protein
MQIMELEEDAGRIPVDKNMPEEIPLHPPIIPRKVSKVQQLATRDKPNLKSE